MNRKALLFIFLILMIGFCACHKEDENKLMIPKIKSEARSNKDGLTTVTYYEYDGVGRLSKETFNQKHSTYLYQRGKIIRSNYYLGKLSTIDTLVLNNQGLIVADTTGTFKYDKKGFLNKLTTAQKHIYNYRTVNDNTTTVIDSLATDEYTLRDIVFTTKINTTGNENKGKSWLGKQNKNLPSHEIIFRINHSYATYSTISYSYEFDKLNRVTQQNIEKDDIKTNIRYTYY